MGAKSAPLPLWRLGIFGSDLWRRIGAAQSPV